MFNSHTLLSAVRMNALFSSVSAVAFFLGAPWFAMQIGLPETWPVYVVAGGLVLFALQLWNIVRTQEIRPVEIIVIIGGDLAWVIATVGLVALFYPSLTTTGLLLVDLVALVVFGFAVLQIRGLRIYLRGAPA